MIKSSEAKCDISTLPDYVTFLLCPDIAFLTVLRLIFKRETISSRGMPKVFNSMTLDFNFSCIDIPCSTLILILTGNFAMVRIGCDRVRTKKEALKKGFFFFVRKR